MADYYVRSTGGSDGNTGLSFAQGWATLAYAVTNSSNWDTIYLCSTESSPFTLTATQTVANPREFIGCDLTDGSAYNGTGQAHIRADASITSLIEDTYTDTTLWVDVVFNASNNASNAFYFSYATNKVDVVFQHCDFKNSNSMGMKIEGNTTHSTFSGAGISFFKCNFYDNTNNAVYTYSGTNFVAPLLFNDCAFYGNGASNLRLYASTFVQIMNCRILRAGEQGIEVGWST